MLLPVVGFFSIAQNVSVSAIARESSTTVTVDSSFISIFLMPSFGGEFAKSGDATVHISTDNYTGYNFSIKMNESTSLLGNDENEIPSISQSITESTFISDSAHTNKWGYKPNQYIDTTEGVETVVNNTNFLPAPSTSGQLIARTTTANAASDTYSFAAGVKADMSIPADTYVGTYVIMVVPNDIVYNITYDENTTDTVTNMPSPNPQATTIDGGASAEDSYATLSDVTPVRNEKKFAGWCDVATTTDSETGDDVCSGNLYKAGDDLPVDQTAGPNITLYAVWVDTLFPVVWNQMGACEFHGATNGNITGSECTDYHNDKFIDTGIALYNSENYLKDYEIHFTIDVYDPAAQVNYYGSEDNDQQTFANAKLGSSAGDKKAPGLTVRRSSGTSIEINSKYNNQQDNVVVPASQVHDISVFRLNSDIYYSINGGPLELVQESLVEFSQQFGLTTWFGAYPRDDCTGDNGPCTNAKRIPEATLSNMYIRLGEYSDDDIHTINFKKNDGTSTNETTYLIKDGNSITTLPAAPTYADHIFQGWFTAQTGGTEVTASTIPTASADYYAQWLGTVAIADITNTQIALQPGSSETIAVTNSAELEPYTFSSSNTGVATVDANTGEVTAVAPGSVTITMTGTISGETKTISVTVAGQVYQVYFDSQGGTAVSPNPMEVGDGGSIDPLPVSIKSGYELEGWYTGTDGTGTKLTTSTMFDSNTPTQYYANWEEASYVCKPAKTLHTETCARTSGGCRGAGYSNGAIITYGSLVENDSPLASGTAFTCDINYDGDFDEEDERFYYYGMNGDNAKFIYYRNISDVNEDFNNAITRLPDSTVWTNPNIVAPSSGTFVGKVASFMAYNDALAACDNSTSNLGTNGRCLYLLEKTNFANTNIQDGYWLATSGSRVQAQSRQLTPSGSSNNATRPAIEVPMDYVFTTLLETYNITFDPHNETNTTTVMVEEGDALGSKIPADPTYTDHLFQGWFTAETGGTQIDATTAPSGSTTYHAQWLKTVALAELARNTVAVEPGDDVAISVTNSAELEPYTFASNDTTIATVNSTTGVVTGVSEGTTTVTMTGTTSGATKTITVNVTSLLPVTQAIIANSDLTTPVGGQITIIVSNAAELEPYTFSSDDTSIATVDSSTGVITGVGAGTANIIMTGATSGLTKTLEVDITAAPATLYTVTFDPKSGSFSDPTDASRDVEEDTAVGALPTPTRTNYRFFGWYSDDGTFYDEVYEDEVITSDVTFYARWVEDTTSFPIVFAEINECTFTRNAAMSGDHCTQDTSKTYVDSGVALFSTANYQKDFEIGFTIVEYNVSSQTESQATLVNSKRENSATNYPGFVMRRSGNNFQLTGRFSHGNPTDWTPAAATVKRVKIIRENGVLKYSVNDGTLVTWYDVNNNTHRFDTNVWFGAATNSNDTSSFRELNGKLTDMYVRLGVDTDYLINWDAGAGTSSEASRTITIDDPVGPLPTVTPPSESYTFDGWFDESVTPNVQITASTIPDGNKTYVAHYSYQSSDEPVVFNIANNALQGYQTIIANWIQSPVNITTFNKNTTTINDSTWGDTSELSERDYWLELKDNFEDNLCSIPSYSDAAKPVFDPALPNWVDGSVDCSKPNVYDTLIDAPLNVYLYDTANETVVGDALTYTEATDGIIRNMIPGNTYKWVKDGDATVYGYVTATSVKGRRFLVAGSIRNIRDLGGLSVDTDGDGTVDGTLAYGRLIRGERIWSNDKSVLTNLGVNKEYDVGNPSEYSGDTKLDSYQNDEIIHYNFDYNTGDENNANSNYMRAWTAVTDIMTDIVENNKNIFFHCRVGADRTGTTAYLLEGLLGVPDEERYQEYSLTHLSGLYDRTRYYKQKSSSNNLKFVFMMDYVKTNADILAWYMHNPDADATLIQNFRNAMTVSNNSQNSNSAQTNSLNSVSRNIASRAASTSRSDDSTSQTSDAQDSYSSPQGVTETTKNVNNTDSAANLAIIAGALAAAGVITYAVVEKNNKTD